MRYLWILLICGISWAPATAAPLAEKYLHAGQFAEGEQALRHQLEVRPTDDQARFELGTVQFLGSVQHLAQSLYRYGARSHLASEMGIPFLRLPVPDNPKPERLSYADARKMLEDVVADVQKAETTLAAIHDDQVKMPLRLGRIQLDLKGDTGAPPSVPLKGDTGDGRTLEPLLSLMEPYVGRSSLPKDPDLLVVFDRGDVAWLRGYCHLLMGLAEFALAHDGREVFDCSAHLFFANVQTPYSFLLQRGAKTGGFDYDEIIDLVSLIHVIRLPVQEPARERAALGHLQQMVVLSQESWRYILAETDDDHEWIPNPHQKGALGVKVTQEMVDTWLVMLAEMGPILEGKVLVPMWRGHDPRGVNLRRVFLEPRPFDLVLWLQGTAATPYLEQGTLTRPDVWQRIERVFRGEFFGFAIWFN